MSLKDRNIFTEMLGVEPIYINSSEFSAQNRRRLYWTNIPITEKPSIRKNHFYNLIIENGWVDKEKSNVVMTSNVTKTNGLDRYLRMGMGNIVFKNAKYAYMTDEKKIEEYKKVFAESGYSSKIRYEDTEFANGFYRPITWKEAARLQTIDPEYLDIPEISKTQKLKMIGNSFTVSVIQNFMKNLKSQL